MRDRWRLLHTPSAPGAWNMAVDEAILESMATGQAPPTLRLYSWHPWCLSLGYFQPFALVNTAACKRSGIDIVRRPTGGSAILHAQELTYSLIAPMNEPLVAGDILTSYRKIAAALVAGLRGLGLPVELAQGEGPGNRHQTVGSVNLNTFISDGIVPDHGQTDKAGLQTMVRPAPCFIRPSAYEIMARGKKLVGSAQMRRNGMLLQHGAIPLTGDPAAILALLNLPQDEQQAARRSLEEHATTVEACLGRPITFDQVAEALVEGFRQAWGVDFALGALSPEEEYLAQRLAANKYSHTTWTERR